MEVIVLVLLVAALIIGELIYRRHPGAGGLLYNLSGTVGGIFWILIGVFLLYGGAYILGALAVLIGVNIHRSNFRASKRALSGRQTLNG